jgi:hypothetical protein
MPKMNTLSLNISSASFGMDSTALRAFIAKIWLFLSFSVEACCHFAPPTLASKSHLSLIINNKGVLLTPLSINNLASAMGRGWGWGLQTESKGNFCLITVYTHKEACCHFAPPKTLSSASNHPRQKTNFFKQRRAVTLRRRQKKGLKDAS